MEEIVDVFGRLDRIFLGFAVPNRQRVAAFRQLLRVRLAEHARVEVRACGSLDPSFFNS